MTINQSLVYQEYECHLALGHEITKAMLDKWAEDMRVIHEKGLCREEWVRNEMQAIEAIRVKYFPRN